MPDLTSRMLVARLQDRVVMHVDFDYFFAQVEERENPAIRDKPVVVCVYSGRGGDSGAVSTANYIARKHGVRAGIPIALAKKRLKDVDAVFLPVNHALYDAVSERIMNLISKYGDEFEQVGVDEAFLDVTSRVDGSYETARELATEIKREILVKERITCSIGIGPNKLVAKIAAGRQKPDGLTLVKPEEVKHFLSPLPARELVGVGKKTEKTLQELGIKTIGELAACNVEKLVSVFGRSLGTYLHDAASGIDKSPVRQRGRAESVSRIATLKEDTRSLTAIIGEIDPLTEDVYSTVSEQSLSFRSISIVAVMNDLTTHSRSKTLENPTKSLEAVKETVRKLWEQLLKDEKEHLVRRAGVKLSHFVEEKGQRKLLDFLDSRNQKGIRLWPHKTDF